jgi:hypothetical protein
MTFENIGQRVSDNAARLRSLQSSSAHLPPARRRDYLRQELRKAIGELPAHERIPYLEALASEFPADAAAPASVAPAAEPAPDNLLELLSKTLAVLDPTAASAFRSRVRGLIEMGDPPNNSASGPDLRTLLRYESDQVPHLQLALTVLKSGKLEISSPAALELLNVIKTAALLIDTFGGIESVFWKIWGAAAPKSQWQTPFEAGFFSDTARLLEGRPGGSFAGYSRSVTQSGQVLVAMLGALPAALDRLAAGWLDQFAPERIAAEVRRTERGPLGGQPEHRFWREYEYRCADFTPARLSETFFRHLVDGTGAMLGSPGTPP